MLNYLIYLLLNLTEQKLFPFFFTGFLAFMVPLLLIGLMKYGRKWNNSFTYQCYLLWTYMHSIKSVINGVKWAYFWLIFKIVQNIYEGNFDQKDFVILISSVLLFGIGARVVLFEFAKNKISKWKSFWVELLKIGKK